MIERLRFLAICLLIHSLMHAPSQAADRAWNAPVSNDFESSAAWTGGIPPAVDGSDRVLLGVNGTYDVQFDIDTETFYGGAPHVGDLSVNQTGAVSLVSSDFPLRSLIIDGAGGGQDLLVSLGTLNLGRETDANTAFRLVVAGDARIQSATVNVWQGSRLEVVDFIDVAAAAGQLGTLNVSGAGANLNVTGGLNSSWGRNGGAANVTFDNAAAVSIGGVELANTNTAGTTGNLVVRGGATLSSSSLQLATAGGASTAASIDLHGVGSAITQSATANLTIGHTTSGTAVLNVGVTSSGGSFTTGSTGAATINRTGTVTVGGAASTGTFTAANGLTINGGILQTNADGIFTLGTGKTLAVTGGGRATFASGYATTANAIYNVSGANSKIETTSGQLQIDSGAAVNLSNGGRLLSSSYVDIATSGNGSLAVDGAGSLASSGGGTSWWGTGGTTAAINFSNTATGNFGPLEVARSSVTGTAATVNILSGSTFTSGLLRLAADGGAGNTGTINVQGASSSYTVAGGGSITLGHTSAGTGAINVGTTASGATFTTGTSSLTVNRTGQINVVSATTSGTFNLLGNASVLGEISVGTFGTLNVAPGRTLILNSGGLLTNSGVLRGNGIVAGDVLNGGVVDPGTSVGTLTIDGNYTQLNSGTLRMSLASAASYDRLVVEGSASLGGQLLLELAPGYTPASGTIFDLVDWNEISDGFSALQYPQLPPGLTWNFDQLESLGIVRVQGNSPPGLPGDYNADGQVDIDDYDTWKSTFGFSVTAGTEADGNFDSMVDAADYAVWRDHLGASSGSASIAGPVPEPATGFLAIMGFIGLGPNFLRRR
jgi:hypothetical protein